MLYLDTNYLLQQHNERLKESEQRYQSNDQYLQYLPTTTLLGAWERNLKRLQRRLTERRTPQQTAEGRYSLSTE